MSRYRGAADLALTDWLTGLWDFESGLVGPAAVVDLISGRMGTSASALGTPFALTHQTTTDTTTLAPDGNALVGTAEATLFVEFEKRDATARSGIVIGQDVATGGSATICCMAVGTAGQLNFQFGWYNGANVIDAVGQSFSRAMWAASVGPRGMEIWRAGVRVASSANQPTRTANATPFVLGKNLYSAASDLVNYYAAATSRWQMPAETIAAITANPQLLFMSAGPRKAVSVAVGADLSVDGAASTGQADVLAASQIHALTVSDADGTPASDLIAIQQIHTPALAEPVATSAADVVALAQAHAAAIADPAAIPATDSAALTQAHTLALEDATATAAADSVSLNTTTVMLGIDDAAASPTADVVALTQVHATVISDAYIEPEFAVIQTTQTHALQATDAIGTGAADMLSLNSTTVVLSLGETMGSAVIDVVPLSQAHALFVYEPYIDPEFAAIQLAQVHALAASDCDATPALDVPAWFAATLGDPIDTSVARLTALRAIARATTQLSVRRSDDA